MRSVEEIEAEIAKLTPGEVRRVAKWLAEYEAELWDKQIEQDAAAGKLNRFIEEALEERRQGKTDPPRGHSFPFPPHQPDRPKPNSK